MYLFPFSSFLSPKEILVGKEGKFFISNDLHLSILLHEAGLFNHLISTMFAALSGHLTFDKKVTRAS